jgi:motility quorum-sensing regulator/GCU-specific mRNA interferase toxin
MEKHTPHHRLGEVKKWQDVYNPATPVGKIYLKLTIADGVVILSFKEL